MSSPSKNTRFQELDALRGIAALMVMLFHFTMKRPETALGFKLGTTGVDLFFIISGFVIFMSLIKTTKSTDFILNRLIRLYPTYWAAVTFTFILFSIASVFVNAPEKITLSRYLGNMSMFQFYLKIPDLDGPYWTMIIEMIFYVGIWFLFKFKLLQHINKIGIFLSIVMVISTQLLFEYNPIRNIIFWIPLLQFIPLFLAGTVFYKIHSNKNNQLQNYLIILLCLICQILLFNVAGRSNDFINTFEYACMLISFFGVFTLFVNRKLSFIVNPATLFLGRISFALYLTHQYVSLNFIIPLFNEKLNLWFWPAAIIAVIISISIATFITYVIEVPATKKLKTMLFPVAIQNEVIEAKNLQVEMAYRIDQPFLINKPTEHQL